MERGLGEIERGRNRKTDEAEEIIFQVILNTIRIIHLRRNRWISSKST